MTPDQIKNLKKEARTLGIDQIVRAIATAGTREGPNASAEFDEKTFRGSDAGTMTAGVTTKDSVVLYEAAEHGAAVLAFRNGPWVERAKAEADRINAEKAKAAEQEKEKKAQEEAKAFMPYQD